MLSFGVFNALWIGLALRLQASPYNLDTRQIGLLSLVAITGAMAAPMLGRLADRFSAAAAVRGAFAVTTLGWIAMLVLPTGYVGLVAGMVLVNVGVTASDVTLRTALYGLAPEVRMRLNSVYSTGTFAGGSLFSLTTPIIWTHWGWSAVSAVALAASILGLVLTGSPNLRNSSKRKGFQ
jgi:MFS family permease